MLRFFQCELLHSLVEITNQGLLVIKKEHGVIIHFDTLFSFIIDITDHIKIILVQFTLEILFLELFQFQVNGATLKVIRDFPEICDESLIGIVKFPSDRICWR